MSVIGKALATNAADILAPGAWLRGEDTVAVGIPGFRSVDVTPNAAMGIAAVYACVTVIAESMAALPFGIFEWVGNDGGKRPASDHPIHELIHDQPNDYQSAMDFWEWMFAMALLRGKGVARILSGPRGPVDKLVPLHPDLLRRVPLEGSGWAYHYQNPRTHETETLLPEQLFILGGRLGTSVIEFARRSAALDLAMTSYAEELYSKGTRASGALQHPKTLSDPARQNLQKAMDEYAFGGSRSGKPLLLEEGMTWQTISLSQHDAQWVESSGFNVAQWARWFRVPLHKIQDLSGAAFRNIERQAVEFITDTLMPWAERSEQAVRRDLILAKARFFAEHNMDAQLRGDPAARATFYAQGRQWGWLSTNDVRRKENMNPVPWGEDDFLVPLNMVSHGNDGSNGQPPSPATAMTFAPRPSLTTQAHLRLFVRDNAARVVRAELAALAKIGRSAEAGSDAWRQGVTAFYAEHASFVARVLHLPTEAAEAYAARRCSSALDAVEEDEEETITALTEQALERADHLRLPEPKEAIEP